MRRPAISRFVVAAVCALCVFCVAPAAHSQERPSDTLLTVNRYLDYETAAEPRVSPDGTQLIWTRRYVDKMKDNFESALWLMNADGTKQRFLVKGGGATWSPDGSRIAYLAEGEPGGMQVWVRYMDAEGATLQVDPAAARAVQHQVVARRQVDRVQRLRACRRELADRHAERADRRPVDQGAPDRRLHDVSGRSDRVPGRRVHPSVHRARHRRARRGRSPRANGTWADGATVFRVAWDSTGRRTAGPSSSKAMTTPRPSSAIAAPTSTRWTSRAARCGGSPPTPAGGPTRACHPTAAPLPSPEPLIRRTATARSRCSR